MTIAAGFFVKGGILMCADRELGGPSNTYERKIAKCLQCAKGAVVFAYAANDSALAYACIRKCSTELSKKWSEVKSIDELMDFIESRFSDEYNAHVVDPTVAYSLLIAVSWAGTLRLYSTRGAAIRGHSDRCCLGSGTDITLYLVGSIVDNTTRWDITAGVLSWAIAEAKKYMPGVGGETDMYFVDGSGSVHEIPHNYIRSKELLIGALFYNTRNFISPLVDGDDDKFDRALEGYAETIRSIRKFTI